MKPHDWHNGVPRHYELWVVLDADGALKGGSYGPYVYKSEKMARTHGHRHGGLVGKFVYEEIMDGH